MLCLCFSRWYNRRIRKTAFGRQGRESLRIMQTIEGRPVFIECPPHGLAVRRFGLRAVRAIALKINDVSGVVNHYIRIDPSTHAHAPPE